MKPMFKHELGQAAIGNDYWSAYDKESGLGALITGMTKGLMYNSANGPDGCFTTVADSTIALSNVFYVMRHIYLPWYLPEAQLVIQDNIALMGGFYTECSVNTFFDSMTTLISAEGISSLGARGAGAYLF